MMWYYWVFVGLVSYMLLGIILYLIFIKLTNSKFEKDMFIFNLILWELTLYWNIVLIAAKIKYRVKEY